MKEESSHTRRQFIKGGLGGAAAALAGCSAPSADSDSDSENEVDEILEGKDDGFETSENQEALEEGDTLEYTVEERTRNIGDDFELGFQDETTVSMGNTEYKIETRYVDNNEAVIRKNGEAMQVDEGTTLELDEGSLVFNEIYRKSDGEGQVTVTPTSWEEQETSYELEVLEIGDDYARVEQDGNEYILGTGDEIHDYTGGVGGRPAYKVEGFEDGHLILEEEENLVDE